ncbi:FemAB family protein [Pseudanabaena sp. UWO310]|uniref:FemAB family protein n=1 Tax=Pseudanabaena sp. UWO310 TaxID=2480795 RepID=UPI001158CD64|nr:FemAB family protein [Pseudanabaena sp. UWO310]TYQ25761.1 FemAB family protein [Pseudanabaena sp. UWO310]
MLKTDPSKELLGEMISQHGVQFKFRTEQISLWDKVLSQSTYAPVNYTNESIDYQWIYQQGHGGCWLDISLIIYWNNVPSAIWPLSLSLKDEQYILSSHGLPILPPLIIKDCPKKSRKTLVKICLDIANTIAQFTEIDFWQSSESFGNNISLSEWHVESMRLGAEAILRHELYLDISPHINDIKSGFRKSYKSLVSVGTRLWSIELLENSNTTVWDEFRNLHLQVSGRITRSIASWDIQLEHIRNGNAFLVYLRNNIGEMVGGGLFNLSHDEGVYSVGAYDRKLFNNYSLGHIVQYKAIEEMKTRNIKWYKLGSRRFISESPKPTEKEISISEFKHGFASHLFPHLLLRHPSQSKRDN